MNRPNWRSVAELVGVVTIVASLIFVGFQLQLERQVAVLALSESEISSRIALNLGMSEHADIWDKANRGESLSGPEALVMSRLVDAWFRRTLIGHFESRSLRGGDGSTTRSLFSVMLFQNPGARRVWEAQRQREHELLQELDPNAVFINDFAEKVRADLGRLDANHK